MKLQGVWAELGLDLTPFSRGLEKAQGLLTKYEKNLGETAALASGIGAALAGGLAVAAKLAIGFEAAMRNVNSIAKESETVFAQTGDAILQMAGEVGQTPEKLAQGLYDIQSSGFAGAGALEILRQSAVAATAGLSDTATASRAIVGVLNAYGLGADQAAHVSDVLFQTVNRGVLTFSDLAQNLGEVVSAAAQANVSLEEIGAAIATMTKAGMVPAEAFTSLNQLIMAFIAPSEQAKAAAKVLGFELSATTLTTKGLKGAVAELGSKLKLSTADLDAMAKAGLSEQEQFAAAAKAMGLTIEQMAAIAPNIRALRGLAPLLANDSKNFATEFQAMADATGATAAAFEEQSKSLAMQWQKTWAALQAGLIQFGQTGLPVLQAGASILGFLVRLIEAIPGPVRALLLVQALLYGSLAGLVAMLILLKTRLWDSIKLFAGLATAMTSSATVGAPALAILTGGFRTLGLAVKGVWAALGPWGQALTVIFAVVDVLATAIGIARIQNDEINTSFSETADESGAAVKHIKELIDTYNKLAAARAKIKEKGGKPTPEQDAAFKNAAGQLAQEVPGAVYGYEPGTNIELIATDQALAQTNKAAAEKAKIARESQQNQVKELKQQISQLTKDRDQALKARLEQQDYANQLERNLPIAKELWKVDLFTFNTEGREDPQTELERARKILNNAVKTEQDLQKELNGTTVEYDKQNAALARLTQTGNSAQAATEKIIKEIIAARKPGFDALQQFAGQAGISPQLTQSYLKQYKDLVKQGLISKDEIKDDFIKQQAELTEAEGDGVKARLMLIAAEAEVRRKKNAEDKVGAEGELQVRRYVVGELKKLQKEQAEIVNRDLTTTGKKIIDEWHSAAESSFQAGKISAAQYIDQLGLMLKSVRDVDQAKQKAGGVPLFRADERNTAREIAAEYKKLQDAQSEANKKLEDEKHKQHQDELEDLKKLSDYQLKMLQQQFGYQRKMNAINGMDDEYSQAQVALEEAQALAEYAQQPNLAPDTQLAAQQRRLDLIEEAAKAGVISASEGQAMAQEAFDAMGAAQDQMVSQIQQEADQRQQAHEQIIANLQEEANEATNAIGLVKSEFMDLVNEVLNAGNQAIMQVAQSAWQRFAPIAAGNAPVNVKGGNVYNIYYDGKKMDAGQGIKNVLDELEAQLARGQKFKRD